MSNFYNPDYPVSGVGNFMQHTYTNNNASIDAMYFNSGMGMMPQQFDSRRNMGLNPNGFVPTNPFDPNQNMNTMMCGGGYPTQQQQQQPPVMPFSNYPPSVPQQQTPAFNSLVDSRRTATAVNNTVGSNPWANHRSNMMNSQQQQQQQQMFTEQPSPFVNQYGYTGQPTPYMYDASILNGSGFGRRESSWENVYSQPNVINQPVVDWNNQQQQQYGYGGGMPMPQYPAMNISWREQAERNWGSSIK